jgi:hypothetical protein
VGSIAAETLHFVEHPYENGKYGVLSLLIVGFAVDIEEDDIRLACYGPLDIGQQHCVAYFSFEELDGGFALGGCRIVGKMIVQEIGEDFDEMGFPGAEETGNPDAHPAGNNRIFGVIDGSQVGIKEFPEVLVEFARDHIFIEFLPDDFCIMLIRLYNAVDGSEQVSGEYIFDIHLCLTEGFVGLVHLFLLRTLSCLTSSYQGMSLKAR